MLSQTYAPCRPSRDAIPSPVGTEYRNRGQKPKNTANTRRRLETGIPENGRRQVLQRTGAVVEAAAGGFHGLMRLWLKNTEWEPRVAKCPQAGEKSTVGASDVDPRRQARGKQLPVNVAKYFGKLPNFSRAVAAGHCEVRTSKI
jgi:hypothetical protein